MHTVLFFVMAFGNLLGALIVTRSRAAAVALASLSVMAPVALTREWPIFRTVVAFGFAAGFLRVVQLAHDVSGTTVGSRVLAVTCLIIDPRVGRVPRSFKVDKLVAGAFEIAFAVALFLLPYPAHPVDWQHEALRVLVGACSAYFVVDGVARVAETIVSAFGLDAGPFHDDPIRARTVGEFWSRRWNRAVNAWLREFTFRPTAKRVGVAAGVLAAFGTSALLHGIPIAVAFDWKPAIPMTGFFLLHGVIVIVESRLGVARWPRAMGHVWTLAVFAVTAPLFVDPLLGSLGR